MYRVEVHSKINLIITWCYKLGLWQRGDVATIKEILLKWLFLIHLFCLTSSLTAGAFASDNNEDFVLSSLAGIMTAVLCVKFYLFIWKQAEVLQLLNEICVYSTTDCVAFTTVNHKLNKFASFVSIFIPIALCFCCYCTVISPFFTKTLFFKIAFPLDYTSNEISFWLAHSFVAIAFIPIMVAILFNVFIWYLIFSCALRYELLGRQMVNMGHTDNQKLSAFEKNNLFNQDLMTVIETHTEIKKSINNLELLISRLLTVVFVTSAVCICGSLYCVIFNRTTDFLGQMVFCVIMVYDIFDILMLTYLGNEIKLKSDHFTYCLFESDWIEKPQSTKKSIMIFGELLMRPHEIFVLKLFPLSLETFTRILNSAYTMFNILKSFK